MIKFDKQLYRIKELPEKNGGPLPMSLSSIYNACRSGEIPTTKIGKIIFVHTNTLYKILNPPNI